MVDRCWLHTWVLINVDPMMHITKNCWWTDAPWSTLINIVDEHRCRLKFFKWIKENRVTSKSKLIDVDQRWSMFIGAERFSSMLIHWARHVYPQTMVVVTFEVNRFSLIHWGTSICINGSTWVDQGASIDQHSFVACPSYASLDQDWTALIEIEQHWSTLPM